MKSNSAKSSLPVNKIIVISFRRYLGEKHQDLKNLLKIN